MIGKKDIVVLACSGSKQENAPSFYKCTGKGQTEFPCALYPCLENRENNVAPFYVCVGKKETDCPCISVCSGKKKVVFVVKPKKCITNEEDQEKHYYAHPDDPIDEGISKTWRELLEEYNAKYNSERSDNGLFPACSLYKKKIYKALWDKLEGRFFILSAGWGLIPANYFLPDYNITFGKNKNKFKYYERSKEKVSIDRFNDFKKLPSTIEGSIHFFGGKDYIPLFYELSKNVVGEGEKRYAWYWHSNCSETSKQEIVISQDLVLKAYKGDSRYWHYSCISRELKL